MNNQLQVIVEQSGLDKTKSQYILDNFTDFFEIAASWEKKAKSIIVTNEKQKAEMQMAKVGRLFLKEKRIAIENSRKRLKEQSLREGKAIDGIANVLKALIIPLEEYLEKQEKFIEIQEEYKKKVIQLEIEKRLEEERIAKENAEREEQERILLENEKLKKELVAERLKQEAILAKEREEARKEKEQREKELVAERLKQEAILAKERKQSRIEEEQRERERIAERIAERKKLDKEREEKDRLEKIIKNQIICPQCGHKFTL